MKHKFLFPFILLSAVQSCKTLPDFEAETKQIMLLHNQQRQAHMEKNIELLLGDSSADFIEVNGGVIRRPTRAESVKRFQSYFNAVDFVKWDDVTPPVISFSDDATMATTVVDKLVITRQKLEGNRLDTSHYAWLTVYKKIQGKWRMHRIGSTNQ